MADKNVNVRINYLTNTADVQKLEQLLRSANAASNQLQASAQKAGTSSSAAFDKLGGSIETLRGRVLFLKEAITQSSDPKKIATLSAEYKKLKAQLDQVNKAAFETPKALKQTVEATKSFASQLGQLYTAAKLVFTAGIIREIVSTGLEMAKLSGNVEGVERAFRRAFPDAESIMFNLRRATHGAVSDFELMQRTLQATNLGVAVEKLPVLFEFAAARAQQTGESVDYLVDSIVRGIGRKSILVLDNLGLSATRLKAEFGGAAIASQSVGDVTTAVARIAGVELQKMGGFAETSATKVDSLSASFKNLKEELAEFFTGDSEWITTMKGFIDSFGALLEARRRGITVSELFEERLRKETAQVSANEFMNRKFGTSIEENNKILEDEIGLLKKDIGEWAAFRDSQNKVIDGLKEELKEWEAKAKVISLTQGKAREYVNQIKEEIEVETQLRDIDKEGILIDQEILRILQATLDANKKRNEQLKEQVGIIEDLQNKIEALGDKIIKATTVEQIERFNRQLVALETQLKELQELGKTGINVNASLVFDIKENVGKKAPDIKKLLNSEQLEADTVELGKELGENIATGITHGMEKTDISSALERAFFNAKDELINASIDITANSLMAIQQLELESYDTRLANIRDFYDEQQILAGDNQRAKDRLALEEERKTSALRKQAAYKEKQARIYSILIDTAASIAKTAAQLGFPAAIPFIAIAAANGAAQLSIASRAQPRGFKDGVLNLNGPGTGTSDSIPSRLSKGESVMTAKEWQTSKNVLKEVRAKTLDDDVLRDLKVGRDGVKYVGMDDKRLLSKLDEVKNSFPDIEERAGILYRTKKKNENYRMWVRKSTMG
jgi:hypothetical protein